MHDEIDSEATAQYDDWTGTIAMDNADFKGLTHALGLQGTHPVYLELFTHHVGLFGDGFAPESYTTLSVYTLAEPIPDDGKGIPGMAARGPLNVIEHRFDVTELKHDSVPTDAWLLLIVSAKRLNVKLISRNAPDASFIKTEERYYTLDDDGETWLQVDEY